jgi:hypothetical protein
MSAKSGQEKRIIFEDKDPLGVDSRLDDSLERGPQSEFSR